MTQMNDRRSDQSTSKMAACTHAYFFLNVALFIVLDVQVDSHSAHCTLQMLGTVWARQTLCSASSVATSSRIRLSQARPLWLHSNIAYCKRAPMSSAASVPVTNPSTSNANRPDEDNNSQEGEGSEKQNPKVEQDGKVQKAEVCHFLENPRPSIFDISNVRDLEGAQRSRGRSLLSSPCQSFQR